MGLEIIVPDLINYLQMKLILAFKNSLGVDTPLKY